MAGRRPPGADASCLCRCEVSLCCKPGSSSDWRTYPAPPGQVQPLHPSYRSLLCLPITCFSAALA